MKGRILSTLCSIIALPSLIYYASKFYVERELHFVNGDMLFVSILIGLLLIVIVRQLFLEDKLDKLTKILEEIQESQILNHHENIKFQKNTRRFIMDVKREKGEDVNE
ncbi:MAG: hypothetical protein ACRCTZ_21060 [Sarcina sp.]